MKISNLSFAEGSFVSQLKSVQVTPLIDEVRSVASDSDRYLISTQFWRGWFSRLNIFLSVPLRSSSISFNQDDRFEAIESGCATFLVALDLSTVFNITDHSVLERKLEHTCRVEEPGLNKLKSYLAVAPGLPKSALPPQSTTRRCVIGVSTARLRFWVRCYLRCLLHHLGTSFRDSRSNSISTPTRYTSTSRRTNTSAQM